MTICRVAQQAAMRTMAPKADHTGNRFLYQSRAKPAVHPPSTTSTVAVT